MRVSCVFLLNSFRQILPYSKAGSIKNHYILICWYSEENFVDRRVFSANEPQEDRR